ncbi:XdhC family protein [soil metagenome]
MGETLDVLTAIEEARRHGRRFALATIVAVTGSTYRRPGARLLVPEEGESVGNLSGGCLEGEVEQTGRTVIDTGEPRVEHYDLTADDEVVWGWGLGCNGAITLFIEPSGQAEATAEVLREAIEQERPVSLATVIESTDERVGRGARVVVSADGSTTRGTLQEPELERSVATAALGALAHGESRVEVIKSAHGEVKLFIEVFEPPPRLVVCGAGHDAIPLVAHAAGLGWRVVVADDRPGMLSDERFPGAAELVACEPDDVVDTAGVDERSHVVVMSHNFLRDRAYLASLLGSKAAYVGMLGPRARLERLLDELAKEGIEATDEQLRRVHGPAGLDIGAEGPEEIAVAIVAEIMAVRRKREAGFLKRRAGSIHE